MIILEQAYIKLDHIQRRAACQPGTEQRHCLMTQMQARVSIKNLHQCLFT
jgi:hypothetical protein